MGAVEVVSQEVHLSERATGDESRAGQRHQKGDTFITLKSLQDLHARYMKMLETIGEHCKVHIIDGTKPQNLINAEVLKIIQEA